MRVSCRHPRTCAQLRVSRIRSLNPFTEMRSTTSALVNHPNGLATSKLSADDLGKQATEPRQHLGMGSPGRPCADDRGERRQVQADDAILEERDAVEAEQPRGHGPERGKEERPRAVASTHGGASDEIGPHRNVKDPVRSEPLAQSTDQAFLRPDDFARRSMANQGDGLLMGDEFVDRTREGIQTTGEEDHVIGRKARSSLVRELDIGSHRGPVVERFELELVFVVGKEAQRLDKRRRDRVLSPEVRIADRKHKPEPAPPAGTHPFVGRTTSWHRAVRSVDVGCDVQEIDQRVGNIRNEGFADVLDPEADVGRRAMQVQPNRAHSFAARPVQAATEHQMLMLRHLGAFAAMAAGGSR